MKKQLILLFVALFSLTAQAMEAPIAKPYYTEKPRLVVVNNTNCKLLVEYKVYSQEVPDKLITLERTLSPNANLICKNIKDVQSITIKSYGIVNSCFNKETITAGYIQTDDHIDIIKAFINSGCQHVKLTVSLQTPFALVRPFDFSFAPITMDNECLAFPKLIPASRVLMDVFPDVKNAISYMAPAARHYLGIPEGASIESLENRYSELKKEWDQEFANADAENREFDRQLAKDVLLLLEKSYNTLKEEATLNKLTLIRVLKFTRYPDEKESQEKK